MAAADISGPLICAKRMHPGFHQPVTDESGRLRLASQNERVVDLMGRWIERKSKLAE